MIQLPVGLALYLASLTFPRPRPRPPIPSTTTLALALFILPSASKMRTRSQAKNLPPTRPPADRSPSPSACGTPPLRRRVSIVNLVTPLRDCTNGRRRGSPPPSPHPVKRPPAQPASETPALLPGEDMRVVATALTLHPLRDYPHMRFQCGVHEFGSTEYCTNCFCYVCDIRAAECPVWYDHAGAHEKHPLARSARECARLRRNKTVVREPLLSLPWAPRGQLR